MKKSVVAVFTAAIVGALFLIPVSVQAAGGANGGRGVPPTGKGTGVKNESYMVITVLNAATTNRFGASKYRVIEASRLKDEEKQLKDDWEQRVKVWQDDRKSDPTLAKPLKPIIKKIKTGFGTHQGAENYVKKLEDEDAAKDSDKSDSNN